MRWKLTDLAEAQIGKLKEGGIEVTPQNVLDIQALSLEAIGDFEDGTRLNGCPVIIAGLALWPLTIAASMWRDEVEAMLSETDYNARLFVLAYAMANGHDKDAMQTHGRSALRDVYRWARKLTCKTADLLQAVNDVLGDKPRVTFDEADTDKDAEAVPSYLAQTAMAIFGSDPDIWLYQLSIDAVAEIIARHFALGNAFTGRGGAPKKTVEGLRKLSKYVNDLRAMKNGKN